MPYFATYLKEIADTEKTEVEAALRLGVFGDVPFTVKPPGNGRNGVMDAKYDDTSGYIFHLRAGANSGSQSGAIGIGTDEGLGGGLLISHKNLNWGMSLINNPGAGLGAYFIGYASNPALQMDLYAGAAGIRLQAKNGQGVKDGRTTAGSNRLTSATAAFTTADVGQSVTQLTSVGAGGPFGCIPSGATITAVNSATEAVMSDIAAFSGTGIRFRIGGRVVPAGQAFLSLFDADGSTLRGTIQYGLFDWRTPMKVTSNAPATISLVAKGAASQTADIFAVVNTAEAPLFRIQSSGRMAAPYSATLTNAGLTTQPAVQITGFATSLPVMQVSQKAAGVAGDLIQMLDAGDAVVGRVNYSGYAMSRKTAAPPPADLANGEMTFWYDQANGMFKITAKTAVGTIVSGQLALA